MRKHGAGVWGRGPELPERAPLGRRESSGSASRVTERMLLATHFSPTSRGCSVNDVRKGSHLQTVWRTPLWKGYSRLLHWQSSNVVRCRWPQQGGGREARLSEHVQRCPDSQRRVPAAAAGDENTPGGAEVAGLVWRGLEGAPLCTSQDAPGARRSESTVPQNRFSHRLLLLSSVSPSWLFAFLIFFSLLL